MYRNFFKRVLDIICSVIFIICFWWLYVVVAILVRKKLGSPVIFKQERPGLNGKIFTMYKFRSMTDARDKDGNLLPDEDRLPRFGQLLRSTSLDEIPEIFNVLKGDMSLVGPRPLLVHHLKYYTKEENRRHDVKPGITGWAQVNGRNAINWDEKFKFDLEYVDGLNLLFDIKIILKTISKVIRKEDISDMKEVNVEEDFSDYRERQNRIKKDLKDKE